MLVMAPSITCGTQDHPSCSPYDLRDNMLLDILVRSVDREICERWSSNDSPEVVIEMNDERLCLLMEDEGVRILFLDLWMDELWTDAHIPVPSFELGAHLYESPLRSSYKIASCSAAGGPLDHVVVKFERFAEELVRDFLWY